MVITERFFRSGVVPGGNKWALLLFCLIGYSILNRGFAYIGYYPFFIGEFTLFFYLLKINHKIELPKFLGTLAGKMWVILFLYNLIIFLFSVLNDINESIRNSIVWVYTIFFYVGYCYGNSLSKQKAIPRFELFIFICSNLTIFYFILFPFRSELRDFTMFVYGSNALVGYYSTLHALSIGFIFYFIFYRSLRFRTIWISLGLFLIIFVSQARASILAIGFIYLYIIFMSKSKKAFWSIIIAFCTAFLFLFIIEMMGINLHIEGQRGDASFDFFQNLLSSIFFESDINSLDGTRTHRLDMWKYVIEKVFSTLLSASFGLGYNVVLIDRATGIDPETGLQTILRYPHNSFVSVLGFSGVIGLIFYCIFIGLILYRIIRVSRSKNISSLILLKWYPVFLIGYSVSAFFSTVLEAPFHNFVFWIISGVIYSIATQPKNQLRLQSY